MDKILSGVDASFIGLNAKDYSGSQVTIAGDVNGDGYDDFLISAPGDYWAPGNKCITYLYFGRSSGFSMDMNLSSADASFIDEYEDDYSIPGACAGDINGDGYDDILIGSYGNDRGGDNAGQLYIIFGKASGWAQNTNLSQADASFIGEYAEDGLGLPAAVVGDVNDDGFDDIMVAGGKKTYLIFGRNSGWTKDTNVSQADASFLGEDSSVACAGDVNGDGCDDMLIYGYASNRTYLVFGKRSGWTTDFPLANADAVFWGENWLDFTGNGPRGTMVDGAGDVNGDGYDDFLIGAPGNDDIGCHSGKTYLIFGKTTSFAHQANLTKADASFIGEGAEELSGCAVSGAGDVNGDGLDDIIIGAAGYHIGELERGQTYLILGKTTGWATDTSLADSDASFIGEYKDDNSGAAVDGGGDINGDGYDDILIGALENDDGGNLAGKTYLIYPDANKNPSVISSVKAYSDDTYTVEISEAGVNDKIFIELQGTDGYSSRRDIAIVDVTSSDSSPRGFRLRLMETDVNTGTYRGNFTIKNRTNEDRCWIKALNTEEITVSSIKDPSKKAVIVVGELVLYPLDDVLTAYEDELYNVNYYTVDTTGVVWTLDTPAGWLELDGKSHNLTGTPDNGDVGEYIVTVNISKGLSFFDEHKFTLTVINKPPEILTGNNLTAFEDREYYNDYDSDDDGQGFIEWELTTNATWLDIDPDTGVLTGTPSNYDVGRCWVNVTVSDGFDRDHTNFTLTVININNAPLIETEDVTSIYQDQVYNVKYTALEIDAGDLLTWSCETNASWLSWGKSNHTLYGKPGNDEVGKYSVCINVSDRNNGTDEHHFILEVINVNDRPIIDTEDDIITFEDHLYEAAYSAHDIDPGDMLKWTFESNATWLSWGEDNRMLYGTPLNEHVGEFWVRINVTDGNDGYDEHYFILTVINVNDAPTITGAPEKLEINGLEKYFLDLSPYIEDVDNELSELMLETTSDYAQVDGLTVIFDYKGTNIEKVDITVSDPQKASASHSILITATVDDKFHPLVDDYTPTGDDVPVSTEITITFLGSMDRSSVENAFSISPNVKGDLKWEGNKLIFKPESELAYNTVYTITLDRTARDMNNIYLNNDLNWSFTTEAGDGGGDDEVDNGKKKDEKEGLSSSLMIMLAIILIIIIMVVLLLMRKRRQASTPPEAPVEQHAEASALAEPIPEGPAPAPAEAPGVQPVEPTPAAVPVPEIAGVTKPVVEQTLEDAAGQTLAAEQDDLTEEPPTDTGTTTQPEPEADEAGETTVEHTQDPVGSEPPAE